MRSGISGVRARASRATNAASIATASGAEAERRRRAPAALGRLDDRVDREHQRAGDEDRAGDVGAGLQADPAVVLEQARGEQGRREADRQVDEEDPVPVDRLGQRAAGQQPDRGAGRRDEAVDPDRLRLLARLGEHRDDHPEDHGRGERAAGALHEARRDQHLLALGQPAQQRGDGEDREADHEDALAADQVADAPGEQQQAAERDQVGVDHPGEAALGEAEVVLDRRQRDVHDRRVEDDHQHPDAQHDERDPPGALGSRAGRWGQRGDGLVHPMQAGSRRPAHPCGLQACAGSVYRPLRATRQGPATGPRAAAA